MAKTIKEVSRIVMLETFEQTGSSQCADIAQNEYIDGAMDVLREVEDIAYRRYSEDDGGVSRNRDLIRLINELKGE